MFDVLDLIFAFAFGCLFTATINVIAIITATPPRLRVEQEAALKEGLWDWGEWDRKSVQHAPEHYGQAPGLRYALQEAAQHDTLMKDRLAQLEGRR